MDEGLGCRRICIRGDLLEDFVYCVAEGCERKYETDRGYILREAEDSKGPCLLQDRVKAEQLAKERKI
jgi:hypothetical protein